MINGYAGLQDQYNKSVTYIVVYSNGALSFEDAWMLSPNQLRDMDETISAKTKAMIGTGGLL